MVLAPGPGGPVRAVCVVEVQWWADFLSAVLRAATPLVFCALGVLVCGRAGILNIGVEGSMLVGALAAVLAAVYSGDPWMGVVGALGVGLAAGLVLTLLTVYLPTDQVVTGIAFNLVCLGVTSFIYKLLVLGGVQLMAPALRTAQDVEGGLSLGGLAATVTPLTWIALLLVVLAWLFLYRTGPGLLWRSVGESAWASHAAGLNVFRVRSVAVVVGSLLSALGGAALTLGWVPTFTDNMTMGRGFIALAAVYFGRWHPGLALAACLLFGAGEALAFRAQALGTGLNPYYYLMLPYVVTLMAVAAMGRAVEPRDVGKPYARR